MSLKGKQGLIINRFFIIFGILCIIYYFICLLVYKIIVNFTPFFLVAGVFFILFGILRNRLNKNTKAVFKFIDVFLLLLFFLFAFVEGNIALNANVNDNKEPDYIMVLGCGLYGKNMLTPQYQRAKAALAYIREHPKVKIVVSGGQGPLETISEAEAYKIYFIKNGVKAENIIEESKSKTTMENMKYTADILKKTDGRKNLRIAVVTSNYHVLRAKFLAKRCGFTAEGVPAPVQYLLLPNFAVREYFGVIKSFFLDK